MAFDYKKEYKEFYMPKNKPSIVKIPKIAPIKNNEIGFNIYFFINYLTFKLLFIVTVYQIFHFFKFCF